MVKVGIMICDRNRTCTGNKCFKSIIERDGVFKDYPKGEPIEVVGWMACGGCPGERLEAAPADMKKYGAEVILLASCYLAGYPICPYIEDHKKYIENVVGLPVKVGTHPCPRTCENAREGGRLEEGTLTSGSRHLKSRDADSTTPTNPNFLKKCLNRPIFGYPL
jgi:predicted metal-binding protein